VSAHPSTPDRHADSQPLRDQSALQFSSMAAHEIVGPIDQISSLVALFVQRYQGKIDDEANTLLAHIEAARVRLGNTAKGLRDCFQVNAAEYSQAPVDMNAALDAAVASLGKQIAECDGDIQAGTLPVVNGDRDRLILLFKVIVENAIKFRREGVRPQLRVSAEPRSQTHFFQLSDNGIGIDETYHETIFEPFRRLHGHRYPGSGLGLTLARAIVGLHGGRIWIAPTVEGARVCFELPIA
jgi:light-regulated signal transduction histidine kinase (bacteriophytochrome)